MFWAIPAVAGVTSAGEIDGSLGPVFHCNGQFGRKPRAGSRSDTLPPLNVRVVRQPWILPTLPASSEVTGFP
jgi:hypothetical protein